MKMNNERKNSLINLHSHFKTLADIQWERGNFSEAKLYDSLAQDIDLQILDVMIAEQESNINAAIIE